MDVLWFLKERTAFLRRLYDLASEPFNELKRKISAGEPPYDDPPFDDSGEPPYLSEWLEADEAAEFLGQACISYLAASVKLYLRESEEQFRSRWGGLFEFPPVAIGEPGIVFGYEDWYRSFGIDPSTSGINVTLIAEIVATRNLAQHPRSIGLTHLSQREVDRRKFPTPVFANPIERAMLNPSSEHEIPYMLSITRETLMQAIDEVDGFCSWLDEQIASGPKAVPKSVPLNPGELVGVVTHYFPRVGVAVLKLVAPLKMKERILFGDDGHNQVPSRWRSITVQSTRLMPARRLELRSTSLSAWESTPTAEASPPEEPLKRQRLRVSRPRRSLRSALKTQGPPRGCRLLEASCRNGCSVY